MAVRVRGRGSSELERRKGRRDRERGFYRGFCGGQVGLTWADVAEMGVGMVHWAGRGFSGFFVFIFFALFQKEKSCCFFYGRMEEIHDDKFHLVESDWAGVRDDGALGTVGEARFVRG